MNINVEKQYSKIANREVISNSFVSDPDYWFQYLPQFYETSFGVLNLIIPRNLNHYCIFLFQQDTSKG